ncbi:ParB N-terminal domain-containing protein [Cypionkella sp.]|uniref:ParB/RepB/Spo0J family partition protein n=1 Tax=Cypionkella sp. TaxID=2811411 RepID=UPI00271808B8|nr:ParB N-terminal domain-containing protein [Cypionkella sp.]MDO8982510.1 ParB N-terminal domain-containing protein [Cypionkella sp.]MDP2050513.1 ParB N-terminal domain-containing protein [Cypionkella sp.]
MTPTHPTEITQIPAAEIFEHALLRDRSHLDTTALEDLAASIARDGLRQPIEVWALSQPTETHRYGLISGLRRLTATRLLHSRNPSAHTTIPAFLRTPASIPDAMAQMIAENEIRENLTPWERGLTLATCVAQDLFPTIDAAIAALHPTATKQKRTRLRTLALVAEELEDAFTTPELLSQNQIERLAAALRGGLTPLIHQILKENRRASLPSQWAALIPTLTEALAPETDPTPTKPGRPRRLLTLKQGLTIRREKCIGGWSLKFTGPHARSGGLMDDVMDEIERLFQPE